VSAVALAAEIAPSRLPPPPQRKDDPPTCGASEKGIEDVADVKVIHELRPAPEPAALHARLAETVVSTHKAEDYVLYIHV
jgi:hypothetical protein